MGKNAHENMSPKYDDLPIKHDDFPANNQQISGFAAPSHKCETSQGADMSTHVQGGDCRSSKCWSTLVPLATGYSWTITTLLCLILVLMWAQKLCFTISCWALGPTHVYIYIYICFYIILHYHCTKTYASVCIYIYIYITSTLDKEALVVDLFGGFPTR